MTTQIRHDGWTIEFTVEGSSVEDLRDSAFHAIGQVTKGEGEWNVFFSVTPFIKSGEGVIVKWQAEVRAERASS